MKFKVGDEVERIHVCKMGVDMIKGGVYTIIDIDFSINHIKVQRFPTHWFSMKYFKKANYHLNKISNNYKI